MTARTALITGISGQDGVYLARLLRAEGTAVVGTVRPGTSESARCKAYLADTRLEELDIRDRGRFEEILSAHRPDEIYNLAAFTSVGRSWDAPDAVAAINTQAVVGLLDAVCAYRDHSGKSPRVFQASSAQVASGPLSPYAEAKAAAENAICEIRDSQGLFACFASLHNHESPLRGEAFVTRKISQQVARIHLGDPDPLVLGAINVRRDWGFAGDHVDAMRRLLRLDSPIDLEIGTGISHSLADVVTTAFAAAGIDHPWDHTTTDEEHVRPADIAELVADPMPARELLGWEATVSFEDTIAHMVEVDIARIRSGIDEDPSYVEPPMPFGKVLADL